MTWILTTHAILFLWAMRNLLSVPRNPTEALSWIYCVIFIPVLGPLAYIILGERFFRTKPVSHLPPDVDVLRAAQPTPAMTITAELAGSIVTTGGQFLITADPKESLQIIHDKLEAAREAIYVEFYIIENDAIGTGILDTLIRKAKDGLDIYLIYDWFGSYFINQRKVRELRRAGGHVSSFSPIGEIFKLMNPHLRNHRKLILIDGTEAITGSANLGRMYLGRRRRNQNRDYIVSLTGPACKLLQQIFINDWNFCSRENLGYRDVPIEYAGTFPLVVVDSGPHRFREPIHTCLISLIHSARESIRIATPYFVPSEPILYALRVKAKHGIRIELMIPINSDSRWVNLASSSYARELMDLGVTVHHYKDRQLHSKFVLIDGHIVTLGSHNFDYRSFRLNYELSLVIDSAEIARQVEQIFNEDVRHCSDFVHKDRKTPMRMLENFVRVFSPLL
jgi:cardiolipin synthase A/B